MRKRMLSILLCLGLLVSLTAPAVYAQQPSAAVTADDLIIGENVVLDDVQVDGTSFTQPEQTDDDLIIGENVVLDDVQVDDTSFAQPEQTNDDQPTGQASATLDGATVSARGIPEGGTVTVENTVFPGAEQALISALEITDAQELFSWEISVQDAAGADWQPEGTVELELSLPDVKLHKYTKVYVLHEADDGTQSYIAARVTEEGTLSFVTDGFSNFAGFTVDFDYEGATFSMDGLDSILLSDLMDQLKAPLYVEDVASVSFSDPSLLAVEEQGNGDWLLTSLQAFSTTEALTVTMNDGQTYTIKVTDAQYASVNIGGTTYETDGQIEWYADDDGILRWYERWSSSGDIYISSGKLEILIRPDPAATSYMVCLKRLIINDNADVTIRLSDEFTTASECVIKATDASSLARVDSGSLTLQGISGGTKLVLDGNAANTVQYNPLLQTRDGATNLSVTDVIFRNRGNGGVWVQSSKIYVSFTDCTFESTVRTTVNDGGAIMISKKEYSTTDVVQVLDFTVSGCQFLGNAAGNGGAIAMVGKVYNCSITNSYFTGCTSTGAGGAINISGSAGGVSISDCIFTDCVAGGSGGAINAISDDYEEVGFATVYSRMTLLSVSNCSFTGCKATTYSGGGICITMQLSKLSVSGCDFTGCSAPYDGGFRGGGAICFGYKGLTDFTGWTDPMPVEGVEISDYYYTWDTTKETIIQEIEIKGSAGDLAVIENCSSGRFGGGIMFVPLVYVGKVSIDYVHIDGCQTGREGSAIFLGECIVKSLNIKNSLIENCSFVGDISDGGTIRTLGSTTCVLDMEGCTIKNNNSHQDGGGLYWNANGINRGGVEACSATLRNCTFEGNTAVRSGGGIYCAAVLNIYDCQIKGNTAVTGGGIYQMVYTNDFRTITEGESTELTLDPTTRVYDNTATNGAGIAVVCNATASIANDSTIPYTVKFRLNGASVYENKALENGGGIYFCAATYDDTTDQAEVDRFTKEILIDNGIIRNNIAGNGGSGNGGGIYMDSSENTKLGIVDGHIHSNTANKGNGGGIYLTGKNAVCTITGGTVGGEYAEDEDQIPISGPNYAYPLATTTDGTTTYSGGNGGGIAIYGGARIEMTGGIISHNEAYVGGGIAVRDESVMIADKDGSGNSALISNNKATIAGGGIAVHDKSAMEMNAGTISNNEAVYGGGISIMDSTGRTYTVTESVTNGDGTTTSTTREVEIGYGMIFHGSGVIKDNVAVNLVTSADTNNSANGGGICISSASTMYIDGGTVTGNKAVERVGTEDAFTEVYNGGEIGGGIAVCQGSDLRIAGGQVDGNYAYNGGGIAITGKSKAEMEYVTGTTTGGSVSKNTAFNNGGGIWLNDSSDNTVANRNEIVITGGIIDDNDAENDGGGVFLGIEADFELNEGKITNNDAKLGAGICARSVISDPCNTDIYINGGEISGNTAQDSGGAVYGDYYVNITIAGGDILNNHAVNGSGGGLFSQWYGTLKITGGTIDDNDAEIDGGGLYLKGVATEIFGGTISNNEATNGAGIYIRHSSNHSMYMYGGTIISNVASLAGGGIYADKYDDSPAIVTVSKYTDPNTKETTYPEINSNEAAIGGGVYVSGGADLTVDGGKVVFNKAKGSCADTTGFQKNGTLRGVGGGIFVADGFSATNPSTFTLVGGAGTQMAIYGNLADTGADDVFSNGNNTKLTVPKVKEMNLSGYDFKPEGWFEDYFVSDSNYGDGLKQGNANEVFRYRGSAKRVEIPEAYVTGEGLDTAEAGPVYVNKANAYVCMTLGVPAAVDDVVVVDFGLSVKIDIFANDMFIKTEEYQAEDGSFLSYDSVSDTTAGYKSSASATVTIEKDASFDKTELIKGNNLLKHGAATLNRNDGQVVYKMDASDRIMDSEETFYYVVKHTSQVDGEQKDYYYYAAVTVIPATTIYYEDNCDFVTYHEPTEGQGTLASWQEWPAATENGVQDQDRPGTSSILKGLDADNIYGYDSSYASSTTYSGGSAQKVEVSSSVSARASFTFTGTGFDIVSLCSNKSAVVLVNVFRGEITDFNSDSIYNDDIYVISYLVDTYYGYKYENGEWIVDPEAGDTLYQVPVIKSDLTNVLWTGDDPDTDAYDPVYKNFGYGTYTVELVVGTSWTPGTPNYNTAEFYLDAIRIYNPVNDGTYQYEEIVKDEDGNPVVKLDDNGEAVLDVEGNPVYETVIKTSTTVQDAYKADGEGWPAYAELRDMFIDQGDLDDTTPLEGILFIDGKDTPTLKDYKFWGPNNEVYLNPDQSIAFTMDTKTYGQNVAGIHMGMRGLTGLGNVTVKAGEYQEADDGTVELVDVVTIIDNKVLSTTDLYYDISAKTEDGEIAIVDKVVVITNSGETPISITNVKVTHTDQPQYKVRNMFKSSARTAQIALEILTVDQLVEPIVTPERPALSFNGMISYNVFFSAENLGDLTAADLGLAVFSTEDTEGTVETADEVHLGATEIDGLYMVATDGVHAKYLGDTKYFRAFAKKADGSFVYSKMVSYSAVDYARNALANSNDVKLKQLVVAMLNYGAEAQKFFGYKVDDLMNKDLTADDQALLTGFDASSLNSVGTVDASKVGAFASTGGFTRKSPAISFKGAFEINYFFTPANAVDGDMTLYFWNEDTYNSVSELTAENADKAVAMTLENGTYTAASDEIAAKYLDKTVYVAAVYESDGVAHCSGVLPYSIAAYCQKPPAGVQDLATAAAIYGCTAKQYFGA